MIHSGRLWNIEIADLAPYPYLPGCTTLASLLPSWASAAGPTETLERLMDAATGAKIQNAWR